MTLGIGEKMNNQLISVVIPVYNPGKHLYRCLDSIVDQTYKNLQIILVDDGSTDGSSEVCDKYAEADSRIICVHQPNSGVSSARNKGLELATGEYLHFPDSDDYLAEDTYERLIDQIDDCDAIVFEYYVEYPDKSIQHTQNDGQYGVFNNVDSIIRLFSGFHFVCTKLIKKQLSEGIGFRTDILRGEDTLFASQILARAKKVKFIPDPFYFYVQSEDSATRGSFRKSQLTITKLYQAYESLFQGFPEKVINRCVTYLHDCVIGIYYDLWREKKNYRKEKKQLKIYLRKYYRKACVSAKKNKYKRIKFFLATWFPNLFCIIHKLVHTL